MKKILISLILVFLILRITFAQEVIVSYDESSLSVLNEELRKIRTDVRNIVIPTNYVALTGNQTVEGIKTFSSFPITPSSAPTTNYQVANKKYVDDEIAGISGSTLTQVNDTDSGTIHEGSETTFLSVNKTITSGNTVLLIARGQSIYSAAGTIDIKLKYGTTVVKTNTYVSTGVWTHEWTALAVVTGLSGTVTFSVTATRSSGSGTENYASGDLVVLEF